VTGEWGDDVSDYHFTIFTILTFFLKKLIYISPVVDNLREQDLWDDDISLPL